MILIVDDKAENIFSLKRTLELNGFDVDTADSGEEALKKVLNNTYSVIILDVQMPGMDGFEVAQALSGYSKAKDIPIIFLSAVNTDKKFITKGYTAGGVDYVTKPIDPDIFILKVKTLDRLYKQNRELNAIRLDLLEEVEVRKRAEDNLQKTLKEHRSILESMPQIAFTIRPDFDIEFVNEHWYAYADNAATMPAFHPSDQSIYDQVISTVDQGQAIAAELRIKNKQTNAYRYHLLKLIPVKQDGIVLKWVGTFTDIQEQKSDNELLEVKVKERTEELITKNKELEISNYELQQFASVASHDLQEPLRKIQIYCSIIKDRFLNDDPEGMNNMNRVMLATKRMRELIDDLLDYSRLSINSFFKKSDLGELVSEIIGDLELPIKEKDAIINVGPLPEIEVIPGQIRQVFQNLLINSLKFSKTEERPEINISAEVFRKESDDSGDYCRIEVSDNGIGFEEKYVDKIFAIFQRLNPREAYAGTGIGLAIVKKIIEKHNGTITARSQEGRGATFIMILPVTQINTGKQ